MTTIEAQNQDSGGARTAGLLAALMRSPKALFAVAIILVIVAILAILGIDPLVGVFGSMAGVATVGMVLLMLTTSVAVLVYFVRQREHVTPKLSALVDLPAH